MNTRILNVLACPACGSELAPLAAGNAAAGDELLGCRAGHSFPVVHGIPRLLPSLEGSSAARSINETYSKMWGVFDYDQDRPWGQSLEERREILLRELDCAPEDLEGKLVLDAGCGPGHVSYLLSEMGADVVAADISRSVDAAKRHFALLGNERVEFVQADITRPPFRHESFDIVFSGGVLHHNPDTHVALNQIADLVAPGGQIYAWLYWRVPGLAYKVSSAVRPLVARSPTPVQLAVSHLWATQSIIRQRLRRTDGQTIDYRERLISAIDRFSPRYNWEHTPEELSAWYRDLGFTDMKTTERVRAGFGGLARKPATVTASATESTTVTA